MSADDTILELIAPQVRPLGYEVIHVEIQSHRGKTLRVYIDRLEPGTAIGVEDCVKVSKTLDTFLDESTEVQSLFKSTYDLEVSSPGIFRPLRTEKDYQRYEGQRARLMLFRPLTTEESGNPQYHARNPKQKNFLGILQGFNHDRVLLGVLPDKSAKPKAPLERVTIPLEAISKANLEPEGELLI